MCSVVAMSCGSEACVHVAIEASDDGIEKFFDALRLDKVLMVARPLSPACNKIKLFNK